MNDEELDTALNALSGMLRCGTGVKRCNHIARNQDDTEDRGYHGHSWRWNCICCGGHDVSAESRFNCDGSPFDPKGGDTQMDEITMKKARVTKNFVLYEGQGAVENLYIKQDALSQPFPEEVTVQISF